MAGMEALGRVLDVIPVASGVGFSMKHCSGVGLLAVATGAAKLAFTAATGYGESYASCLPASGFGQPGYWYQRVGTGTGADGSTAAWTKQTASWAAGTANLTISATSGYTSYVDFLGSQLADTYDYLKVTGTNTSQLTAILYDLTVQRKPANLEILSA